MNRVYFLSGLGADQRVFRNIHLPGREIFHLQWIQPEKKEAIGHYAERLCSMISTPSPIIIGLSFGGMMAVEIAKIIPDTSVILISSIKKKQEMPLWMKGLKFCHADKMLPSKQFSSFSILRKFRPVQNFFLGVETEEEKKIANDYRDTVDPEYMNWTIHQVLFWKNEFIPPVCYHIHGSKDRIFPVKGVSPTHIVKDGGHLMVMNKAAAVNKILLNILQEIEPQ